MFRELLSDHGVHDVEWLRKGGSEDEAGEHRKMADNWLFQTRMATGTNEKSFQVP